MPVCLEPLPWRRSTVARHLADLFGRFGSDLIQHVGGKPTAVQRMLIERAATLTGYLARLDGVAPSPAGMSDLRRREYLAADGSLRRDSA